MREQETQGVLDGELVLAIYESVEAEGESERVAERLVSWLGELSLGRTSVGSGGETEQFFDLMRKTLSQEKES